MIRLTASCVYDDTTNMLVDGCFGMKKFENINIKKLNGKNRKKERRLLIHK